MQPLTGLTVVDFSEVLAARACARTVRYSCLNDWMPP
jgi:hypothetical protein